MELIKFHDECVKNVMNENNISNWFVNSCKYLKDLQNFDVMKGIRKTRHIIQ